MPAVLRGVTTIPRMERPITADATRRGAGRFADALVDAELTRAAVGAFYEVYNTLGHGFLESVYSRALAHELTRRGLRAEREVGVDVRYKGQVVGVFRADVLVESRLLLELKATASIVPADRHQIFNYLRSTALDVGLLFCFGRRATFQRVTAPHRPARHLP